MKKILNGNTDNTSYKKLMLKSIKQNHENEKQILKTFLNGSSFMVTYNLHFCEIVFRDEL